MFESFIEWVQSAVGDDYKYSRGMWIDGPDMNDAFIASIRQMGGAAPDAGDRRMHYQVILLGPRDGRQYVTDIERTIESLAQAAMDGSAPCGAASVRAISEAAGPGYTTEDRPWYSLDFQVLL